MSKSTKPRKSLRLLRIENKRKRRLEDLEDLEPPTDRRPPTKLEFMAYLGLMPTTAAEQPSDDKEPVTAEKEPETPENEPKNPEAKKTPDRMEAAMAFVVTEQNNAKVNPPEAKRRADKKMSPYSVWKEHNYVKGRT